MYIHLHLHIYVYTYTRIHTYNHEYIHAHLLTHFYIGCRMGTSNHVWFWLDFHLRAAPRALQSFDLRRSRPGKRACGKVSSLLLSLSLLILLHYYYCAKLNTHDYDWTMIIRAHKCFVNKGLFWNLLSPWPGLLRALLPLSFCSTMPHPIQPSLPISAFMLLSQLPHTNSQGSLERRFFVGLPHSLFSDNQCCTIVYRNS